MKHVLRVARREVGGLPANFSEDELVEWIARSTGRPAGEIRAARRAGLEARGVTLTGDPALDRVRAAVAAALDGQPVRRLPSSGRRSRKATTTPRTDRQSVPSTAAARRAAEYATTSRRNRR